MPLLSRLFELWPELAGITEEVIADSAWDEHPWVRLAEVHYGIHPVFRWHRTADGGGPDARHPLPRDAARHDQVGARTGDGRLICGVHNTIMETERTKLASRAGLNPGEASNENEFRIQARCSETLPNDQPCGSKSIKMAHSWSNFSVFTHHDHGRPDLYARRVASLSRLNQVESAWGAMKGSTGTPGAARRRISDVVTYDAVLSLNHFSRAVLAVAAQRNHHRLAPYGTRSRSTSTPSPTAAARRPASPPGHTAASSSRATPSPPRSSTAAAPPSAPPPLLGPVAPALSAPATGRRPPTPRALRLVGAYLQPAQN